MPNLRQYFAVGGYCKSAPLNFMVRQILYLAFFLFTTPVFGQKEDYSKYPPPPKHPPTKKEIELDRKNHNCAKKANSAFNDRVKNYPFNLSTQIQLVSFKGSSYVHNNKTVYKNDSLPRLNDTICYSKLDEVKNLTFDQIDKLTDILYNYGFKGYTNTFSESKCYNPRNAILFLDTNGRAFEYVEICFECERTKQSSEKISLGEMCDQKMDMLKSFFDGIGIEYGITKGLTSEN